MFNGICIFALAIFSYWLGYKAGKNNSTIIFWNNDEK